MQTLVLLGIELRGFFRFAVAPVCSTPCQSRWGQFCAPFLMRVLQTVAKNAMWGAEHGFGGERPFSQLLLAASRVMKAVCAFTGGGSQRAYSRERYAPRPS